VDLDVRLVGPGPERRSLLPLLLLADDVAERYLDEGDLWVAEGDGAVVLTLAADEPGTVELRNVAVSPQMQGKGIGMAMVAAVVQQLRVQGWRRAVVGTGTADSATFVFYQKCGFRPHHVERDVFTPENGYDPDELREPNGLIHRDMLWFDMELAAPCP
jgi:N-acetylglutamate synthase-like GNAT family acetyltransferase